MSAKTGIEWTDATWNPIRGCSRVSEGCRHCYAESMAFRFSGPGQPYEGLVQVKRGPDNFCNKLVERTDQFAGPTTPAERLPLWNGQIRFIEERLLDPLHWKAGVLVPCPQCGDTKESPCYPLDNGHRPGTAGRPKRISVNSMSDLFHENVTDAMLDRIFAVMALCPQHTFQVLTRRPARMLAYLSQRELVHRWIENMSAGAIKRTVCEEGDTFHAPLPNVWLGVSVENQRAADERIPLLLQTPSAVRFISAEPLLGPVDLWQDGNGPFADGHPTEDNLHGPRGMQYIRYGTPRLDWVIAGGESGSAKDIRPMHPDWARGLRDQCVAAGVPFFFKQWGEWLPNLVPTPFVRSRSCFQRDDGRIAAWGDEAPARELDHDPERWAAQFHVGKKAAGHLLDGREWHQFPAVRG